MWQQLKILDLEITLVAAEDIRLPFFRENALRTALGTSLRATVCATPLRESCRGCELENLCAYPKVFPLPQANPPVPGDPERDGPLPAPEHRPQRPKPRSGGPSPVYLSFLPPAHRANCLPAPPLSSTCASWARP